MVIEDLLLDQQSIIVGPFGHLEPALSAARASDIDFALLDVMLHGVKVFPLAEALSQMRIPFLLLSGYGAEVVPPNHPEWRLCRKPFTQRDLLRKMLEELAGV